MELITKNKLLFVVIVTTLVFLHVIWDYNNGGVPIHHVLADKNLPGISNWWGCLTIPVVSWVLISLTQKRIQKTNATHTDTTAYPNNSFLGFILSLGFGIFISLLWEFRMEDILVYVIWFPVFFSLVTRVHYPEYALGVILGLVYTFGGILPLAIGIFLYPVSFLVWNLFRTWIPAIFTKIF